MGREGKWGGREGGGRVSREAGGRVSGEGGRRVSGEGGGWEGKVGG